MFHGKYLTPHVSDLTQAPRDKEINYTYAILSSTNALIDFRNEDHQIDQETALTLFQVARKTAVETVTQN